MYASPRACHPDGPVARRIAPECCRFDLEDGCQSFAARFFLYPCGSFLRAFPTAPTIASSWSRKERVRVDRPAVDFEPSRRSRLVIRKRRVEIDLDALDQAPCRGTPGRTVPAESAPALSPCRARGIRGLADPVIGKFLEFLARDMAKEPARIGRCRRSLDFARQGPGQGRRGRSRRAASG